MATKTNSFLDFLTALLIATIASVFVAVMVLNIIDYVNRVQLDPDYTPNHIAGMAIFSFLPRRNRTMSTKLRLSILPEVLAEPRASEELSRALIEITSSTEYVQAHLRALDNLIVDLTAKRDMVANALKDALAHKLEQAEPEALSVTNFRNDTIALAKGNTKTGGGADLRSRTMTLPTKPELFASQAEALGAAAAKAKPNA